jgi:hypothetical protein
MNFLTIRHWGMRCPHPATAFSRHAALLTRPTFDSQWLSLITPSDRTRRAGQWVPALKQQFRSCPYGLRPGPSGATSNRARIEAIKATLKPCTRASHAPEAKARARSPWRSVAPALKFW